MNLINKKMRCIATSFVAIILFFSIASIDSILASVNEGVRPNLNLYEGFNFSDDSESGMQGHREDHLIGSEPDEEEGSFVGQTNPIEEDNLSQEEGSESEAIEETRPVPFSSETVMNLTQLNAAIGRANAGETTEIVIAYPGLTITGAAFPIITAADLTIRGETEDTVVTVTRAQGFQVNGNASSRANVRVEDLILDGASGGSRTAIWLQGGFVTTRNVEIRNFTNSGIRGDGGAVAGSQLNLESRTFIHSNHVTGAGGGVAVNNSRIYMEEGVIIYNNTATTNGGGIAVGGENAAFPGILTMTGGRIEGNRANASGGGIHLPAGRRLYVSGGLIYDNEALGGTGGGINAIGAITSLTDEATVEFNRSFSNGGGIHSTAILTISDDVEIINNQAGINGGGLHSTGTTTITDDVIIENNRAQTNGGGISSTGVTVLHDRALIYNNRANLQGGGIHVGGTGILVIQSEPDFASLYRNRAGTSGGGMVTFGRAELRSGIIAGNTAVSNGGGVNVATSMGRFYMPGGMIVGNHACGTSENNGFGGGISITGQFFMGDRMPSHTTIAGGLPERLDSPEIDVDPLVCELLDDIDVSDIDGDSDEPLIIRNVAGNAGGGISPLQNPDASVGGRAFMNRGRITENVGKGTGGGGVNLQGIHTFFTMSGEALIDRNEALSGHGGGIRSVNGTIVIEENATVEYNMSNGHGGGIHAGGSYPNGSLVEMRGGFIQHNEAIRNGGGVNLDGQSRLIMEGTDADQMASIVNNQAGARGGGVSLDGFIANVMNPIQSTASATMNAYSRVSDNVAGMYGGGFYVIGQNIITLNEGAEILRNTATTGGGIRLAIRGQLYMNEGLIQHNTASGGGGGGISLPGSTGNVAYMVMSGGEISENTAVFGGGIGFTAVTNWNMLNTALNRVTIHNTGTTVARNTAVDLVNGIELWGAYPSNPRNTQIRPTNYTLFNEFAVASGWGYNGEGINRFALTNFDIQSQELTRRVTFAAMGPGVVDPNNIVLTVGLGDTIGEENSIPTPIPDSVSSQVCEFTHWISDSSHHWSSDGEYPGGNPNTPFTTEQIRNDLAILEDTVFTAVFSCYPDYVTVDFEAPGGTLRDPNNNNLLDPNDVRLSVVSGNTIAATDLVPRAVHDSSYYEFMYWTSSDPAHPAEISPEEIRDLEITQDTVFTAHFRRMTMPITGIGHPTYFLPLALFALVLIATLFYYRRWKSHVSSR